MKVQTDNINFGARFLNTRSLQDVAKYAKETGCFEQLNNARKNINSAYLTRRLKFELSVTKDEKKIPYVIFTRYTPKKCVTIPKSLKDYKITKPFIFVSKEIKNPLKFGLEIIKKLGNNAPENNMYKQVVAGILNKPLKSKMYYFFCDTTASINPLNNGCGLSGLDLNSGWN